MKITPDKIQKLEDFVEHYNHISKELEIVNKAIEVAISQRDTLNQQIEKESASLLLIQTKLKNAEMEHEYHSKHVGERVKALRNAEEKANNSIQKIEKEGEKKITKYASEHSRLEESIKSLKSRISDLDKDIESRKILIIELEQFIESLKKQSIDSFSELEKIEQDKTKLNLEKTRLELVIEDKKMEIMNLDNEAQIKKDTTQIIINSIKEREEDLAVREKQLLIREGRYKAAMRQYFPNVAI